MPKYLVVAHQTADSDELVEALREIVAAHPDAEFSLIVPATPVEHLFTWTEGETLVVARERAESARDVLRAAGVNIVAASVGDADPVLAAQDALLKQEFDTVILATLPAGISRWVRMDAVHRLERAVDVPIVHVEATSKG